MIALTYFLIVLEPIGLLFFSVSFLQLGIIFFTMKLEMKLIESQTATSSRPSVSQRSTKWPPETLENHRSMESRGGRETSFFPPSYREALSSRAAGTIFQYTHTKNVPQMEPPFRIRTSIAHRIENSLRRTSERFVNKR